MNSLVRSSTKPTQTQPRDHVQVTVVFLGHDDYHSDFPNTTSLRQIRLQSLAHFGIASEALERYVLRYLGGNCPEEQLLSKFGCRELCLTLVSAEETGRFGEALFLR